MDKLRTASLCGCLAVLPLLTGCAYDGGAPLQAYAPAPVPTDMGGGRVYAIAPGAPAAILVMLPGRGNVLTADPQLWAAQGFDVVTPSPAEIYRIAADQQAAAARLIAEARAMATAPVWLVGSGPAIEAAMAGLPPAGPGQVSGVVVTSATSGAGTCSEEMTYSYSGHGQPKVSVTKSGNCPASLPFGSAVGPNSTLAPPPPAARPKAPHFIEAAAPAGAALPAAVRRVAELIKSPQLD